MNPAAKQHQSAGAGSATGAEQCVWEHASVGNTSWRMCTFFSAVDIVVSRNIKRFGCFECDSVQHMLNAMATSRARGRQPVLIDVGGNIGMYSLAAAAAGHEVFTFEPVPLNALKIRSSSFANGFDRNLHLYTLGASDEWSTFAIGRDPINQGNLEHMPQTLTAMQIPVAPLQSVLGASGVDWARRPIFLKMDIEGGECRALRGMRQLLGAAGLHLLGVLIETNHKSTWECIPELITAPDGAFHVFNTRHNLCGGLDC